MRWLPRHRSVPAEIRSALDLDAGERVLASGESAAGEWLIGTDRSLYIGSDEFTEIPWERVERATWDRDTSALVVDEVAEFGEPNPRHTADLEDPRRLLELIRERVTASILLTEEAPVDDSRGLKVIARRSPIRRGDVQFSFQLPEGLDPADDAVRAATDRALARARSDLGMS